jgi:hypothetical protein
MTRSDLAKRTATFMVMVVAGFFLGTYLDQRFTAPDDVEPGVTWNDSSQPGRPVCGGFSGEPACLSNIGSPASASDDG